MSATASVNGVADNELQAVICNVILTKPALSGLLHSYDKKQATNFE